MQDSTSSAELSRQGGDGLQEGEHSRKGPTVVAFDLSNHTWKFDSPSRKSIVLLQNVVRRNPWAVLGIHYYSNIVYDLNQLRLLPIGRSQQAWKSQALIVHIAVEVPV